MNIQNKHFCNQLAIYIAAISMLISTLLMPIAMAQETSVVAIKAGTILPVTSAPIQNGIILIRDGKIVYVLGAESLGCDNQGIT